MLVLVPVLELVLELVLVLGAVVVTAVASQVVQQARHPVRIALVGGEMALAAMVLAAVVLAAMVALVALSTSTMIAVKRTCLNRACCMLCVACRHGTYGYCEYCLSLCTVVCAHVCVCVWLLQVCAGELVSSTSNAARPSTGLPGTCVRDTAGGC